jgi:hypothetical protein
MAFRIVQEIDADETVIVLHGWLFENAVADLENTAAIAGLPLRIDLENLAGANADGVRALLRQQERGARLTGASPYIELLLNRTAGAAEGEP